MPTYFHIMYDKTICMSKILVQVDRCESSQSLFTKIGWKISIVLIIFSPFSTNGWKDMSFKRVSY